MIQFNLTKLGNTANFFLQLAQAISWSGEAAVQSCLAGA